MHHRLGKILKVIVSLLHLLPQRTSCSIVARGASAQRVLANLTICHAHGEVGIRIVWHIHLHTQYGSTEQLLLLGNVIPVLFEVGIDLGHNITDRETILNTQILVIALLVEIDGLAALHQYRLLVQGLHIGSIVTMELLVNGLIEVGQIVAVNLQTIVTNQ